jgi:GntR family transcriptional regulator
MPEDFVPDYARVAEDIRSKILSGDLPGGTRLPTKLQLMEQYGVGAHAIDTAMVLLRSEGLVIGHQGRGRWVAPGKAETGNEDKPPA